MQSTGVTNLPFLLWVARNSDWQITECSHELLQACTYTDKSPVGAALADLIGAATAEEIKTRFEGEEATGVPLQMPATIRRQDGTSFAAMLSIARIKNSTPLSFAFFAYPAMTLAAPKPRGDTAVADHAKFDAFAIIAQGMGHEINNPLQIILGTAEHLATLTRDETLLSGLQEVQEAGERIQAAVANLKDFVKTEEK